PGHPPGRDSTGPGSAALVPVPLGDPAAHRQHHHGRVGQLGGRELHDRPRGAAGVQREPQPAARRRDRGLPRFRKATSMKLRFRKATFLKTRAAAPAGTSGQLSSARSTRAAPASARSLPYADSRGRYFMPQSGARTSRSGAWWAKARRALAATVSTLSTSGVDRSSTPSTIVLSAR